MNWLNRLGALCVCWPSSKCLVVWCKCIGGMQGSEGRCRNMSGKISTISTWGASASADASEHQHVRAKHSRKPFSTYLNAWAAAATPRSVPSSSFGRRQRAASFLSSLVMMMAIMMNSEDFLSRGNFPREISFSEKSRLGSLLPRTLGQSLSSASRPEIKDWRYFSFVLPPHLEEGGRVLCASLDGKRGVLLLRRLLWHQLLGRKKNLECFYPLCVFLFHSKLSTFCLRCGVSVTRFVFIRDFTTSVRKE